jgi:hypothetical protein
MSADALPALGCLCGKRMMESFNDGTCLWCGHGAARPVHEFAYMRLMGQSASPIFTSRPAPVTAISGASGWTWDEDRCARAALAEEARTGRFPGSQLWQRAKVHGEHRPSYATVINRFGSWAAFKRYCAEIPRESVAA